MWKCELSPAPHAVKDMANSFPLLSFTLGCEWLVRRDAILHQENLQFTKGQLKSRALSKRWRKSFEIQGTFPNPLSHLYRLVSNKFITMKGSLYQLNNWLITSDRIILWYPLLCEHIRDSGFPFCVIIQGFHWAICTCKSSEPKHHYSQLSYL